MQRLSSVSDDALLHELLVIVGSHRRVTAELVLHLGEVDARRLHVEKGFSSLFSYCVEELRFSEDEACRRIEAARLARRFPAIHSLLETAAVSLTVLGLLKPHLTDENHREMLAGVCGSSVRQAKEWLAAQFPQPDVPSTIRKQVARIPARVMPPLVGAPVPTGTENVLNGVEPSLRGGLPASTRAIRIEPSSQDRFRAEPAAQARAIPDEPLSQDRFVAPPIAATRARIEPLSQDRFLVKFTASRVLREKLEQACDLMRHANPKGDIAVVLEHGVDLLIAELEKKKQGRTDRPRKKPRPAQDTHMTRATRREVVGRDGWRCSFVAEEGRRCNARGFLEFDHKIPRGCGGSSEAKNLRLLCRAHNRWAAERAYGKAYVACAISASRSKT
jgi:hypothetical protein